MDTITSKVRSPTGTDILSVDVGPLETSDEPELCDATYVISRGAGQAHRV